MAKRAVLLALCSLLMVLSSCRSSMPITSPEKRAELEELRARSRDCSNCGLFVIPNSDGSCPECGSHGGDS